MKIPYRKLKALLQYLCLAAVVLLVGYNVNHYSLKEEDNGAGHVLDQEGSLPQHQLTEEEVWAAAPREGAEIPRMQDPHVGLENIMEDSKPGPDTLIDWHNWTQIQMERERVGPGEQDKYDNKDKDIHKDKDKDKGKVENKDKDKKDKDGWRVQVSKGSRSK